MGIIEGCPGYWGRDSSSHGYCSFATCKGSEPSHIRKTQKNQWLFIPSTVPARLVSFYAAQRTRLAEFVESVPIDGIPQLHPVQSIRMLLYSRTFSWTFTAQSHFAFPELYHLVCILLVAILLTGSLGFVFFLISHYIPGSVSSTLHVSSCPSFLSNKYLFHSCNLFCFFSPLAPPADPAFIYAQPPQLHPVGLPFSLACVQYSYLPPLPMTSQHFVVLRVM